MELHLLCPNMLMHHLVPAMGHLSREDVSSVPSREPVASRNIICCMSDTSELHMWSHTRNKIGNSRTSAVSNLIYCMWPHVKWELFLGYEKGSDKLEIPSIPLWFFTPLKHAIFVHPTNELYHSSAISLYYLINWFIMLNPYNSWNCLLMGDIIPWPWICTENF